MNTEKLLIKNKISIKEAIRLMDEAGEKILFFVDNENKLLGTLTDGDIRRWILKDGSLQDDISKVYKKTPLKINKGYDLEVAKKTMTERKVDALPVVDEDNKIVDVLIWTSIFKGNNKQQQAQLGIPVVIMAGGKGTRLDPFTKILPKPLIPFGDKPIIEIIMDRFSDYGCNDFYLTVNYKGKMIQAYFDSNELAYKVTYLWEDNPYGTAGSLKLAKNHIKTKHLFVSNCDILIKADYSDIYQFHLQNDNDITVIGSMQHFSIPYGVLEMKTGGSLASIIEKPEYDLFVNTGLYLIKKEVINQVPANVKYDFPELMLKIKNNNGKVGIYPVSQQSWIDIGQWQEYHNAVNKLES